MKDKAQKRVETERRKKRALLPFKHTLQFESNESIVVPSKKERETYIILIGNDTW